MAEELLKPRAAYEAAAQNREVIAEREARLLVSELMLHKSTLDDHGYTLEAAGSLVAIRRGPLDIVRVVFNYANSGKHRVTNGIAEALRQGLDLDVTDPNVARHEFKTQLRYATELFYTNKPQFEALGLA